MIPKLWCAVVISLFGLWYLFPPWGVLGLTLFILPGIWAYYQTQSQARFVVHQFENEIRKHVYGDKEFKFVEKHAAFYVFPITARNFSISLSFINTASIIFAIISAIRSDWVSVGLAILFCLLTMSLAGKSSRPLYLYRKGILPEYLTLDLQLKIRDLLGGGFV